MNVIVDVCERVALYVTHQSRVQHVLPYGTEILCGGTFLYLVHAINPINAHLVTLCYLLDINVVYNTQIQISSTLKVSLKNFLDKLLKKLKL